MKIREANILDLKQIKTIYNQGIEDRIATFEMKTKDDSDMEDWFDKHQGRYTVLVAEKENGIIAGWASINQYNQREAYNGVGELSIYIHREDRGKKIGQALLSELEEKAKGNNFYKIVLFTFTFNQSGLGLYTKMGFREVGIFEKQGKLDGEFVDIRIMEKLLLEN